MLKKRLIATLLCRNGRIVQSVNFRHTNVIGNVITAVDFFNSWSVDEIIILDISPDRKQRELFYNIIRDLSRRCFVPLTVGGWIDSVREVQKLLSLGADKITINTKAFQDPDLIRESSDIFGTQCIVVSIDTKKTNRFANEVFIEQGKSSTGTDALEWAKTAMNMGAGELYITSIDHDGSKKGYDLELIRSISQNVDIPVIASGGVGDWEHLIEGITVGKAQAVSAANIFHYTEHSTKTAKDYMIAKKLDVRKTFFYQINQPRKPRYETQYRV